MVTGPFIEEDLNLEALYLKLYKAQVDGYMSLRENGEGKITALGKFNKPLHAQDKRKCI